MTLLIPQRKVLTRPPNCPAKVDFGNDLTGGLVVAVTPAEMYDSISGALCSRIGNVDSTITAGINSVYFTGVNYRSVELPDSRFSDVTGNQLTVSALVYITSAGQNAYTTIIGKDWSSPRANPFHNYALSAHNGSVATLSFVTANGAGGSGNNILSSGQYPQNRWVLVTGVLNGTSKSIYIDGVNSASNNAGASLQNSTGALNLGSTSAYGESFNGAVALALVWNRALNPLEVFKLSENPWQIFEPKKQFIFLPAATGGGPLTGNSCSIALQTISGDISQTNITSGINANIIETSSSGVITQLNLLTGAALAEALVSAQGNINQTNLISGDSAAINSTGSTGTIGQTNLIEGNSATCGNQSSTGAISQINLLISGTTIIGTSAGTGGITQEQSLAGASCLLSIASSSGDILLGNAVGLTGVNSTIGQTSSAGLISQINSLLGANCSEIVLSSTGSISVNGAIALTGDLTTIGLTSSSSNILQVNICNGANASIATTSSSGSIAGVLGDFTAEGIKTLTITLDETILTLTAL